MLKLSGINSVLILSISISILLIIQFMSINALTNNKYHYHHNKNSIFYRYNFIHKSFSNKYHDISNENQKVIKDIKSLIVQSSGIILSISPLNHPKSVHAINNIPSNRFGAVGYEASESAFSPGQRLVAIPLLPQSSLLNTLPLDNELVGQLQAFIESFVQLINPSSNQINQINQNTSALWSNLRINAQRAAGMFLYNKEELLPLNSSLESIGILNTREKYGKLYLKQLQNDLIQLVNSSRASNRLFSLQNMQKALNSLCNVAYLQVPLNRYNFYDSTSGDSIDDVISSSLSKVGVSRISRQILTIPRLKGRAMVKVTIRKNHNIVDSPQNNNGFDSTYSKYAIALPTLNTTTTDNRRSQSNTYTDETFTILVDGLNHPLTAGNFIDLCQKGFYDNNKIENKLLDSDIDQMSNITIFGNSNIQGYIDPVISKQRRIPLEIFRENSTRIRYTALGSAKNSAVFTKALPIQSFATYGAIGMYHSRDNPNDASSAFFWYPVNHNASLTMNEIHEFPLIKRLDQKYSLFAYVIEGLDILPNLQHNDLILTTEVQPGLWQLIPPTYDSILIDNEN